MNAAPSQPRQPFGNRLQSRGGHHPRRRRYGASRRRDGIHRSRGVHPGQGKRRSDERPQRTVWVDACFIDRFEVTAGEYRKWVEEDRCTPAHSGPRLHRLAFEDHYTNWNKPGRELFPDNAISWYQADRYCRWAGKRLPSEEEWEKAAPGRRGQDPSLGRGGSRLRADFHGRFRRRMRSGDVVEGRLQAGRGQPVRRYGYVGKRLGMGSGLVGRRLL